MIGALANLVVLLVLPWVLVGVVGRARSLWTGRRGPPILQPWFDVVRLARKRSVVSDGTTPLFRIGPWVALGAALGGAAVVPLVGVGAVASFPWDFVWLAYLGGLGRIALMLAALDTGSPFEGLGSSREATWATILEPAAFLVLGALCLHAGQPTLHAALVAPVVGGGAFGVWIASAVALVVIAQSEGSRSPIDDPATHLELTMIHEVMVLDHAGPDLAAIHATAAVRLTVAVSVLASVLDPAEGRGPLPDAAVHLALCLLTAAGLGTVESLMARFQLKVVPRYLLVALVAGAIALLATTWQGAA